MHWALGMKRGELGRARVEGTLGSGGPRKKALICPAKDFVARGRGLQEEHSDLILQFKNWRLYEDRLKWDEQEPQGSWIIRAREDEAPS